MISSPFLKIVVVLEELDEGILLFVDVFSVLDDVLSEGDRNCSVLVDAGLSSTDDDDDDDDEEDDDDDDDDDFCSDEFCSDEEELEDEVLEELLDALNTGVELFFSDSAQPARTAAASIKAIIPRFLIIPP